MNKLILFILIAALLNIFLFTFSDIIFAQQSKFYQLDILFNKGKVELKTITILPGSISEAPQIGDYKFELRSLVDVSLYSNNFQIPSSVHGERFDPKTGQLIPINIKQENAEIVLNVPYFRNGKEIDVYDPQNKKILTIPVQQFTEVTQTPISPTPQFKVTKMEKGIGLSWIIGGGILFFVIAAIGVFIYLRFKKPQNLLQ